MGSQAFQNAGHEVGQNQTFTHRPKETLSLSLQLQNLINPKQLYLQSMCLEEQMVIY